MPRAIHLFGSNESWCCCNCCVAVIDDHRRCAANFPSFSLSYNLVWPILSSRRDFACGIAWFTCTHRILILGICAACQMIHIYMPLNEGPYANACHAAATFPHHRLRSRRVDERFAVIIKTYLAKFDCFFAGPQWTCITRLECVARFGPFLAHTRRTDK